MGSYPTGSPLPVPSRAIGGVFSVALSVACEILARAQALPGSLPYGARTFLGAPQGRVATVRPAVFLTQYNQSGLLTID